MGHSRKDIKEALIHCLLFFCGCFSIITTLGILAVLLIESLLFFTHVSLWDFLTDTQWTPLFSDKHFGIMPLLGGTLLTSLIALIVALPFGLLIAIYLSEYATPKTRRMLKTLLEVLAGIPTIVYGYFALLFVTPLMQIFIPDLEGFNALSPGIVMGFMILPMIASLSEDALFAVPRSLKQGAYALGASRLQMVLGVLVPSALGGIIASVILAMARAVGETMIVAIAAGQQPVLTLNPLRSIETMTAYIVQVSLGDTPHGTLEYHTIFAVGLMLFILTFILNSLSIAIRERYKRSYA
ncbi:MAG: phosphate ABC transporter permease subunit PstC [Proteobacteria bacterium]|nr:MAG: phosphate ABC transporter permease subunit PstC [Pseudomonadota bacterium]